MNQNDNNIVEQQLGSFVTQEELSRLQKATLGTVTNTPRQRMEGADREMERGSLSVAQQGNHTGQLNAEKETHPRFILRRGIRTVASTVPAQI